MEEHFLTVSRTARYYTMGNPDSADLKEVWIVCHGYGQLASYFLENFKPLESASRLIVAPEALSRFYLSSDYSRVGASWMTREIRLEEINDYLAYLSALYHEHLKLGDRCQGLKIVVLGFSQGAATVWRWLNETDCHVDTLILWAGMIPNEFRLIQRRTKTRLIAVIGKSDPYINDERAQEFRRLIEHANLEWKLYEFEGGHTIDTPTLLTIAASDRAG